MKTYQFKIPCGDIILPIQAKGFTQKGAYKKACRIARRYEG